MHPEKSSFWTVRRTSPRIDLAFYVVAATSAVTMAWILRSHGLALAGMALLGLHCLEDLILFLRRHAANLRSNTWVEPPLEIANQTRPRSRVILVLLLLALGLCGCAPSIPRDYAMQEGDLLFQSLPHAPLVDAIEGVSLSPFSHCGLLARSEGNWVVIEAIGPVRETPLTEWIGRGRGTRFSAYRLNPTLAPQIPAIIKTARTYLGRPYDVHYKFDDERIYCSELIYKSVKATTGQGLGRVEKLGDLNWKPHEAFIRSIEGYVPLEREMITPQALSEAPELTQVYGPRP